MQAYLTLIGDKIKVSGDFGPGTKNDVMKFQGQESIRESGIVGPVTKRKLEDLVMSQYGSSSIPSDNSVSAQAASASGGSGGSGLGTVTSGFHKARLVDGLAIPAPGTPEVIQQIIWAANDIAFKPYVYGGGHNYYEASYGNVALDSGYDCSGSVSFALHGGGLLAEPDDSTGFEDYGRRGGSKWITIYTNAEHAYMDVAGLRFDTVAASYPDGAGIAGDRWSTKTRDVNDGVGQLMVRHPVGW